MAIQANSGISSDTGKGPLSLTGIGTNIDANAIISKLMLVNSKPLEVLKKHHTSTQTQLSAVGKFAEALSTLQQSLTTLSKPSTFNAVSATSSNATIVGANAKNTAVAGNYLINVTQLAQAQTISSVGVISPTGIIGNGEKTSITFQFGSIHGSAVDGKFTNATFTPDAEQATGSITIDSSNNSLKGIANAINSADIGVQASIVGDGSASPYHLVIHSSKSGITSGLKITVNGDPALKQLLSNDPAGTQHFTQVNAAQNANLTVNGLVVSSKENTVSNVVDGLSFSLHATGSSTVNVATNTSSINTAINDFVNAYNGFAKTVGQLTSYNPTTKVAGAMLGNPTVRAIQNQIQSAFNQPNSQSGMSLTQIGISFQRDGTLAIDTSKLQKALTTNLKAVGEIFSTAGISNDAFTKFIGSTPSTQAGSYSVNISKVATHGTVSGSLDLMKAPIVIAENTSFKVSLDHLSASINLPAGTYSATEIAARIQGQINGTKKFSEAGATVTASISQSGYLQIQSDSYGSKSTIQLTNETGTDVASILGSITTNLTGNDVAGTINGVAALGNGKILTAAKGSAAEGLAIQIEDGKTGNRGKISYSRGYAYELEKVISEHLSTGGSIKNEVNGFNKKLTQLESEATNVQSHLNALQKLYQKQFSGLDTIISRLQSKQNFLTSQMDVLNGKRNR
ncbi:flagellar filament capping protein FliD [Undibacterium sp. Ji67W]